jgi:hypothetical protein
MNIHQLSVNYEDRQDRLLLRVNTQGGQEYRLWLTRRLTGRLLPHLQTCVVQLEALNPQVMAADASAQQMLTELQRETFLQKADFQTPFTSQDPFLPLGQDPILVTDVQLNLQNNGTLNVVFQDKSGNDATQRSCQLGLESTLLHGLLHLIDQALQHANWRMETPPNTPASQDKGMEEARTARPAYTH